MLVYKVTYDYDVLYEGTNQSVALDILHKYLSEGKNAKVEWYYR